jgi:hypothetical protein
MSKSKKQNPQTSLDLSAAAEILNQATNRWMDGSGKPSIWIATARTAAKLSSNPVENLAAYLRYDLPCLESVTDKELLKIAATCALIVLGFRPDGRVPETRRKAMRTASMPSLEVKRD